MSVRLAINPSQIRLSIITFNVGDIWGEKQWNNSRWQLIMSTIVSENADIIILQEVTNKNYVIFEEITTHSYAAYTPYVTYVTSNSSNNLRDSGSTRDSWEVIYSKIPVSKSYYVPFSIHEGLSCIQCHVQNKNDTVVYFNICGTTWNPSSKSHLKGLVERVHENFNSVVPLVMTLSMKEFGSYLMPPRHVLDSWTYLGSPRKSAITLNPTFLTYISDSNSRADHIWSKNAIPLLLRLININEGSEHNGLYAEYIIESSNNHKLLSNSMGNGKTVLTNNWFINTIRHRQSNSLVKPLDSTEVFESIQDKIPTLISRSKSDNKYYMDHSNTISNEPKGLISRSMSDSRTYFDVPSKRKQSETSDSDETSSGSAAEGPSENSEGTISVDINSPLESTVRQSPRIKNNKRQMDVKKHLSSDLSQTEEPQVLLLRSKSTDKTHAKIKKNPRVILHDVRVILM